jgi:hypothetical protein
MYLRIIASKLNDAITTQFSGVYAIQCRPDNLFAVYDRETDVAICGAVYLPKTDTYRPETAQDAADFSRWLVAQPVPIDRYPGGLLEYVLRTVPPTKLTLRANVIYGDQRTYTFTGYRADGHNWEYLDRPQYQDFNEAGFANLLAVTGWALTMRPVKQNGIAYHYLLERATADQVRYSLSAGSGEYVERARQNRAFEGLAGLEAGGSGITPIK